VRSTSISPWPSWRCRSGPAHWLTGSSVLGISGTQRRGVRRSRTGPTGLYGRSSAAEAVQQYHQLPPEAHAAQDCRACKEGHPKALGRTRSSEAEGEDTTSGRRRLRDGAAGVRNVVGAGTRRTAPAERRRHGAQRAEPTCCTIQRIERAGHASQGINCGLIYARSKQPARENSMKRNTRRPRPPSLPHNGPRPARRCFRLWSGPSFCLSKRPQYSTARRPSNAPPNRAARLSRE